MRCETEKNLSLHSYEELYQFANQLYNHEDINDRKETREDLVLASLS